MHNIVIPNINKTILTALFISGLLLVLPARIHAQDFAISNFKVELKISADNSVQGNIGINLVNNKQSSLVNGYTLSLPVRELDIQRVILNNQDVSFSKQADKDSTNIIVDFKSASIRPGNSGDLSILFSVKDILKDEFNVKYIYIPSFGNNFLVKEVNYDVIFPASFKKPQYITYNELYSNTDTRVSLKTSGSFLAVWGDYIKADIISDSSVINPEDSDQTTIYNIPVQSKKQNVFFKEVSGSLGLVDNSNNYFSLINLAPKEEKKTAYSARVTVLPETDDDPYPSKYNWNLNSDSIFGQKMIGELAKGKTNLNKMTLVNQLLKNSFDPYANEKIDNAGVENIWVRTNDKPKFNSFEYCFFIISAAEHLDLQARIDYGYLLLPNIYNIDSRSPHIWCTVKIDSKNIMFDPYLEDFLNGNYIGENHMDRIKFGTWHFNQPYNNILGLVNAAKTQEQIIKIVTIKDFPVSEKNLIGVSNFPQEAFSGEFYSGDLKVFNGTTNFLPIKDIKINDESVLSNSKYKNYFTIGLLPKSSNIIHLENLREKNFLFDGRKEMNTVIQISKPSIDDIKFFTYINFKFDQKLLTLALLVTGIGTLLLGVVIWRITKRPKYF